MSLPPLTLPEFPLPFEIATLMHPAIVHFAVALPVVILLLEIINLAVRRKAIGSMSVVLMVLMVLVYFGAYLTGGVDAHAAKDALTPETKALLDTHTNGGVWLVYASAAILLLKLISLGVKRVPVRIVYLVAFGLFFWAVTGVVQRGCDLTYQHGINVHKDVPAAKTPLAPKGNTAGHAVPESTGQTVKEAATKAVKQSAEAIKATVKTLKKETADVVKTVHKKVSGAMDKASEAVNKTTEQSVKVHDTVKEKAKDTVQKVTAPAQETPHKPVTPVETIPAG